MRARHRPIRWDLLPPRRVVVRFEFPDLTRKGGQLWMIFDGERSEVCRTNPGFDEDLVVMAKSRSLADWHLGRIEWEAGLRAGEVSVDGPPKLAKALPTWNRRSGWAKIEIVREGGAGALHGTTG